MAVVGAHQGAGTSTVALALAYAAASAGWPVHLVSCNPPAECGLVGAASVELGTDPAGAWRTGRRGAGITVARPAPGQELSALCAPPRPPIRPGPNCPTGSGATRAGAPARGQGHRQLTHSDPVLYLAAICPRQGSAGR